MVVTPSSQWVTIQFVYPVSSVHLTTTFLPRPIYVNDFKFALPKYASWPLPSPNHSAIYHFKLCLGTRLKSSSCAKIIQQAIDKQVSTILTSLIITWDHFSAITSKLNLGHIIHLKNGFVLEAWCCCSRGCAEVMMPHCGSRNFKVSSFKSSSSLNSFSRSFLVN